MSRFEDVGKILDIYNLEKSRRTITRIVIHCSVTPLGRHHDAKDIHRWHLERGWPGIGYHYVMMTSGEIQQGRSIHYTPAQARGYNVGALAAVVIGGTNDEHVVTENAFTADQMLSLESLVKELHKMYPEAEIVGHRDLPYVNKACPCLEVSDIYKG